MAWMYFIPERKEMKGGRSGDLCAQRIGGLYEDGGAPRRLERRPPSSPAEENEA